MYVCVPAAHSSVITQGICSRDFPSEGCVGTSLWGAMWWSVLTGLADPYPDWLPGGCLVWMVLAASYRGLVVRLLTGEPQGALRLVLAS